MTSFLSQYDEEDEGSDDEGMLCELQLDHFY